MSMINDLALNWTECVYVEISVLFIKCNLTLAVISFYDLLISALHGKRKESFIFLTLLFKSHSSAALLGILPYKCDVLIISKGGNGVLQDLFDFQS